MKFYHNLLRFGAVIHQRKVMRNNNQQGKKDNFSPSIIFLRKKAAFS